MPSLPTLVQVLSVMTGVVISILSFNNTRQKEALARLAEARKPFLELRQRLYLEALGAAGVLANPSVHSENERTIARKRFRELYVAELSMVEVPEVETKMKTLAKEVDPELTTLDSRQRAAYDLAHALRDSFVTSWGSSLSNRRE